MKKENLEKYMFEFISIFVALTTAFALNNWKENKKDSKIEQKILVEIKNGLERDIKEVEGNILGHQKGIKACHFWREIIRDNEVKQDSLFRKYMRLTRDITFVQNTSGYEALKSKGLELIENDSLRFSIITLYEHDYRNVKTLEESYEEMQFQKNYFHRINEILSPYFFYSEERGYLSRINYPIEITDKEINKLLSYLMKIETNRKTMLVYYKNLRNKMELLSKNITVVNNGNK